MKILILENQIYVLRENLGNPKERDTHLCLRFFQNNLVNPKIALTNLLKYMTPKIITKPPKVCDTHIK